MRTICWDLDETLGYFRPIAEELIAKLQAEQRGLLGRLGDRIAGLVRRQEESSAESAPAVRLRGGVREVLLGLAESGYRQVVTTGSFEQYARMGLERVGVLEIFEDVFGRERIWDGRGKVYQPVLETFGLEPDQIMIVGDSFKRDRASDHQGVVMICQPDGLEEPGAPLLPVIRALGETGRFPEGFARLQSSTQLRGLSRIATVEGIEFTLDHWGDYRRGERTPVVSALRVAAEGT